MGAYACVSGTYNSANAANECSGACDDAQCCTPAWAATCGEQTEGQADAYACVAGTYNSANAANECSGACDDAQCCTADHTATCGDVAGDSVAFVCGSGFSTNAGAAATECPQGTCDDATCCTADAPTPFSATCGEPTEGANAAHSCTSPAIAADAGTACPNAGCDDATCCEEAPIAAFLCECGEADANDDTIIVWTNECTDGEAACDDTTDEPVMEGVASAVHVSAVVMMVFSFLW